MELAANTELAAEAANTEQAGNFVFAPIDNDEGAPPATATLGPLTGLVGNWSGPGFNAIWRPHHQNSDHFLELNVTNDQIDLQAIPGVIPNRGFVQGQIFLSGLTYLQQISDANVIVNGAPAGLHIEPGIWISIPALTNPQEPAAITRMASIPHGTTILIQGTAEPAAPGGPSIPDVSLIPFFTQSRQPQDFPERHLNQTTPFRTSGPGLTGITQAMLNNPNKVLTDNTANVASTTRLHVSTTPGGTFIGGGASNMAFLVGDGAVGNNTPNANANAARVEATFWLQTLEGDTEPTRLQYSQTVVLNFNGLSWPHITVATLTKS